jgi:hypothetical protein
MPARIQILNLSSLHHLDRLRGKRMKTVPVHYYFNCSETGVEMSFSRTDAWGWGVSFPCDMKGHRLVSDHNIKIPWPELSKEQQGIVDENYRHLNERMRGDDD